MAFNIFDYFNPKSNGGKNFWSTPIAREIAGVQKFIESPAPTTIVPQVHPFGNSIPGQIGNTVLNLPGSIINTVIGQGIIDPSLDIGLGIGRTITGQPLQSYGNLKSSPFRLGYNLSGVNSSPQNIIGNVAGTALPIAAAYGGGSVAGLKGTIGSRILGGVKTGAGYGAGFGGLQGLSEGRNLTLKQQFEQAAMGGAVGGVAGGILGGAVGGIGGFFTKPAISKKVAEIQAQTSSRQAETPVSIFTTRGNEAYAKLTKPQAQLSTRQQKAVEKLPDILYDFDKGKLNQARATEYLTTENKGKWNEVFNPVKNLSDDMQRTIIAHDRSIKVARVDANNVALKFKNDLDPQLEWKLVQYSQSPGFETASRLKLTPQELTLGQNIIEQSRKFNDELFMRAKQEGVQLNYLQNHIYQAFKESPEKIDQVFQAKGLSGRPGWVNHRTIDNFETGIELKLTPKFSTFGQLNALAQESLDRALANKRLVDSLKASGQLLPESQAPAHWEAINAKYFPKQEVRYGTGDIKQEGFKAPPELAKVLNNYLGGQAMGTGDVLLSGAAKVSRAMQDVVLSGGINSLNAFGLGQLFKEMTAFRFIKPLTAFIRPFIFGASKRFEEENIQYIREMASQGIGHRGITNYKKVYYNVAASKPITQVLGDGWDKWINEPTFIKFLTQLQISFFKDLRQTLIKNGKSEAEAIITAGEGTRRFYGIQDNLGRSEGVDNLLTTIFLAPRYREGLVNVYFSIARAFKPGEITAVENRGLQRLALGAAITYGLLQVAQQKLTGTYTWDNPPGKEFELVVPVGDPKDKKYISVPMLPGFTAVPRRVLGSIFAAIKGDFRESAGQIGGLASIPAGKLFEIIRNKDYFGNEIIGEENPYQDASLYAAKSFLPGYGRGALDVATGKATPAFGMIEALELPVRKGSFPNSYFTARDEALEGLTSEEIKMAERLLESKADSGLDSESKAKIMLENPKMLEVKKKIALAQNPNDPLYSLDNNQIKAYLAYQVLDDSNLKAQLRVAFPFIPQVQYQLSQQFYSDIKTQQTPTEGYDPNSWQGRMGALLNPPKEPSIKLSDLEVPTANPMQQLTEAQVQVVSAYTASPKGSLERKQLLANNPWLVAYWKMNEAYYAANPIEYKGELGKFLAEAGIGAGESLNFGGGYSPSNRYASLRGKQIKGGAIRVKFGKTYRPIKIAKLPRINKNTFRLPEYTAKVYKTLPQPNFFIPNLARGQYAS